MNGPLIREDDHHDRRASAAEGRRNQLGDHLVELLELQGNVAQLPLRNVADDLKVFGTERPPFGSRRAGNRREQQRREGDYAPHEGAGYHWSLPPAPLIPDP